MRRLFAVALFFISPELLAGSQAVATHAALSTAAPYATKIGLRVLQSGGSAADAAVAVAMALGVAQPQATGLGGGGFLLYYDAASGGVWALDFREVAPITSKPTGIHDGAAAAGVPGFVAGLAALHERFGKKPWRDLVAPAVLLATDGVEIDADLAVAVARANREKKLDLKWSEKLVQPELAASLQRVAEKGAAGFYDGETARRLVETVHGAGGSIGVRDLHDYKPVWRAPLKIVLGDSDVYCAPPPSSGGIVIASTLKIAAGLDLRGAGRLTPKMLHLLAEAERRAFVDADKYAADPGAGRVPLRDLLGDERARLWRASIDPAKVTPTTTLTEPVTSAAAAEGAHTTHVSIADAHGNMIAMTTSLGDDFGSGFLVAGCGFFLNAALNDFSTTPGSPNALEPGKRPVTAIAPTLVVRGRKPLLALGTPGGSTIATTEIQVLLDVLLFRKPLADAIEAPRFHQQARPEELMFEQVRAPQKIVDGLRAIGHAALPRDLIGDVHAVMIDGGKIVGVADSRHGGAAGGY